ncbi:sugar phosphorylase [uncultured Sunxiuqinia sp.]|uniref:sugar phosphorylase n=1 Tax=uncultured Sunxiuqinia sp. TaxID=1573825 RepID=UPI002AA6EE20|nr:sugar phosphorylase [uncultured Sunxiuqinia sp.]
MHIRLRTKLINRLNRIYRKTLSEKWIEDFLQFVEERKNPTPKQRPLWDERKVVLITYGDVVKQKGEAPLETLRKFANEHFRGCISTIHILPFFPYSSDDGFSVMDFYKINPELGDWSNIEALEKDFLLMADLVANHASSKGIWFKQFLNQEEPGKDYFFVPPADFDTSKVIRPRSSPLLSTYDTVDGPKKVWTTFSADQVDLDYANPEVLKEMLNVFLFYLSKGIRVIRLDAIAFLWKASGLESMHEQETHEIVSLFREIMDYCYPGALLLTETNVPHRENITYFGLGDEAHLIYQFALPPLILHALHTGNGGYLTRWAKELNDPQKGMTYLNFTSSHDGIGVRPLEGVMPDDEKLKMVEKLKDFGAKVTTRQLGDKHVPYEINVTFYDALKGTKNGEDEFQNERFLQSQTIMLSLQGVPAFYFLNLLGIENDNEGLARTGVNRSINRRKFTNEELEGMLQGNSRYKAILKELIHRTGIRRNLQAFSPNTQQLVLELGDSVFAILRKADQMEKSVVCLFNLTDQTQKLSLPPGLMEFSRDLITRTLHQTEELELKPYQSMWLITRFVT